MATVDAVQRFRLKNGVAHLASIVLIACFFISLVFTVLPRLPFPKGSEDWGWAIVSWNLAGPLMFIMVFRIHALRVIKEHVLKAKKVLGITLWVKFWFTAAVTFGLLTLPFLVNTYFVGGAGMPWYLSVGTATVVIAWFALLFSTISLLRVRCSKAMLPAVGEARKINRILLASSSIVFLFFTGLSSVTILVP